MIARSRPFTPWHGSQCGRSPRARSARVSDGYDPG